MKRILSFMSRASTLRTLAVILLSCPLSPAETHAGIGKGLAGYWSLNDGGGATAAEVAGAVNDQGTLVGGPVWGAGIGGGALDFDGVNDRVEVPLSSDLTLTNGVSISAWVNVDAGAGGTKWILSTYFGGGYYLRWNLAGGTLEFNGAGSLSASVAPSPGTWVHVCGTFDAASGTSRIYVNGAQVASGVSCFPAPCAPGTPAAPLTIGSFSGGSGSFDGRIDEVYLHNRALTPAEAMELATEFGGGGGQAPADFNIEGFAGGRAPWTTVNQVNIDSTGAGTFSVVSPEDRDTGALTPVGTFQLTGEQMTSLWSSVTGHGFFGLDTLHAGDVNDGSFCTLRIRGNGLSHEVVTMNTAVAPFDALVTDINEATPDTFDLIYNELLPGAPQPFPASARAPDLRVLAGEGGTIVTRNECTITVTLNIDIFGSDASDAVAAAFKQSIENKWNGPDFSFGWCPVKFVAKVNNGISKVSHHLVRIFGPKNRSYVNNPLPPINGEGGSGAWRSNAGGDNGAAHEAGHLMGLDDEYKDDPKTKKSVPNPGHENDIMASRHKGATPAVPTQAAIDQIINAAGITCPEFCCIFDPVPIPPYLCSVGQACQQVLTASNREGPDPIYIFQAYATDPAFQIHPQQAYIPPLSEAQFTVTFTPQDQIHYQGWVILGRQVLGPGAGGFSVELDSIGVSGDGISPVGVGSPAPGLRLAARPNPFAGELTVDFALDRAGRATLEVLDMSGRRVERLLEGWLEPGPRTQRWLGRDERGHVVPPGIYVVRLRAPGVELKAKTILVR